MFVCNYQYILYVNKSGISVLLVTSNLVSLSFLLLSIDNMRKINSYCLHLFFVQGSLVPPAIKNVFTWSEQNKKLIDVFIVLGDNTLQVAYVGPELMRYRRTMQLQNTKYDNCFHYHFLVYVILFM